MKRQARPIQRKTKPESSAKIVPGKPPSALCLSGRKKTENLPRLYDLTTLQWEANRLYSYTAKQTLDYTQSLYEKKLCTYPRTDSQYLTDDMLPTAENIVSGLFGTLDFAKGVDLSPDYSRILNSKKVTDHHAIIPTAEAVKTDKSSLPESERNILLLLSMKLLSATAQPYRYEAVTASFSCGGVTFTAKGKTVKCEGFKELERRFRATLKAKPEDEKTVKEYAAVPEEKKKLFAPERKEIGKCPRCGFPVYEGKKNFYCSSRDCQFSMWKNDRFFTGKKKELTATVAAALLSKGRAAMKGLYSEKTGKTYDADVLLADTGEKYVNYKIELKKTKKPKPKK